MLVKNVIYTYISQLTHIMFNYFEKLWLQSVSDCLAGVDDDFTNSCSTDPIHVLQTCLLYTSDAADE